VRILVIAALALAACGDSDVSREVGARCDDNSECDDVCLGPHPNWPDGFCSLSCDDDDDCPPDTACIEDEGGVCVFTCTSDTGCAFLGSEWTCQVRNANPPDGTVMVCRGE
jgi:hypothetical protein